MTGEIEPELAILQADRVYIIWCRTFCIMGQQLLVTGKMNNPSESNYHKNINIFDGKSQ